MDFYSAYSSMYSQRTQNLLSLTPIACRQQEGDTYLHNALCTHLDGHTQPTYWIKLKRHAKARLSPSQTKDSMKDYIRSFS